MFALSYNEQFNCCFVSEQVIIYNVGLIPSKFYKCLGDKDRDAFQALMLHAIGLVMAVAFVCINVYFNITYCHIVKNLTFASFCYP